MNAPLTAAEWRKHLEGISFATDLIACFRPLLRDFEAAEQGVKLLVENGHRLSDRCVAAEEERNAAEKHVKILQAMCEDINEKAIKQREAAEARARVELRHALWVERRYWRDILPVEARAQAAEAEARDWKGLADRTSTAIVEYGAMREKAEDEAARLREALQSIAANTCCDTCREAALVAQAALAPQERGGEGL